MTDEKASYLNTMLEETKKDVPDLSLAGETHWIDVAGGKIRVIKISPENPSAKRPLVFVPGWGTRPDEFNDFYEAVHGEVTCYFVETREKNSSKMEKRASFTLSDKAHDVKAAVDYFGLTGTDYLLFGTCWGATIVTRGMMETLFPSAAVILFDPMHTLWAPKWILRWVAPITPVFLLYLVRPIIKAVALRGMNEEVQRARTEAFVDNAELWKWKRAAMDTKDFEMYGNLSGIDQKVFVVSGTHDKIHQPIHYPRIASELPNGAYLYMGTDESNRERLMGVICREFCKVHGEDNIPKSLNLFQKPL